MTVKFTDEKLHQKAINSTKRKFAIYPSAYANAWMVRRYKQLYKKRNGRSSGAFKGRSDALDTWFKEKWVGFNSPGKIVGECGSGKTKGKVKCLPALKARSLSKRDRSRLAKRKQSQGPNPNREGMPVRVSSKTDAMDPATLARAIVSIERKYGLRLNARLVWLHMDSTPCGKGWVGTKPGCERAKGGDEGDAPDVVKGKHAIGPELLTRLESATSTSILSGNKEIQKLESLFNKIFDKDPVESFNSPEFKALAKAEKDATKGREDALAVMNEVLDKLSQITRARAAKLVSRIEIGNSLAKNAQEIREYLIEYAQLSGGLPKSLKKIFATSTRAYVNMDAGIVNLEKESSSSRRKSTLFHEVGHFGEMDGVLDRRMSKWRNDRATGPEDTLNNIANKGSNLVKQFDDDEMGVPGPFVDVYVGKTYTDGFTEVFSMGMERMISPETMLDFYKDDPDHFFLTVGASRHG